MRRRLIGGGGAGAARRRRWQVLREKRRRGIFLLPSLLTTANLFCGFLAILLTANGRYEQAAVAIIAAIVLDILDGKVARLTNTTTQFGLEFDSLADLVSFCVAPAFLLYAWGLSQMGRAAWAGCRRRQPPASRPPRYSSWWTTRFPAGDCWPSAPPRTWWRC
ncbi:MAG: CDP-alcohol phosphatidyltransferase family protein [Candidatus Rokubacteria bacterium]|nr:CDP-alcohol phosphatidyltransferase family protein [Candidatus Rokubacteria bacterium]